VAKTERILALPCLLSSLGAVLSCSGAVWFGQRGSGKLDNRRRLVDPSGFERLSGCIHGAEIDLQIIPDMLTYRKLPCFWLLVSQIAPLPIGQKISLMVRPTGFETLSQFSSLPYQTSPLPANFPSDGVLRSERALSTQEMGLLQRHLAIFSDPCAKELVLTPQGCRISWLLQQANRGRYLLFREAELNRPALEWAELAPLLEMLQTIVSACESRQGIDTQEQTNENIKVSAHETTA